MSLCPEAEEKGALGLITEAVHRNPIGTVTDEAALGPVRRRPVLFTLAQHWLPQDASTSSSTSFKPTESFSYMLLSLLVLQTDSVLPMRSLPPNGPGAHL